jgi:hypothetical protein
VAGIDPVTVMVRLVPDVMVPIVQVAVPVAIGHAVDGVAHVTVVPVRAAGIGSVTTTLVALPGPMLLTVKVQVAEAPVDAEGVVPTATTTSGPRVKTVPMVVGAAVIGQVGASGSAKVVTVEKLRLPEFAADVTTTSKVTVAVAAEARVPPAEEVAPVPM